MKLSSSILTFLLLCGSCVHSSKVLMLLPLGSKSHKNIFTPLADNLGRRGHQVTIVSMYGNSTDAPLHYKDVEATETATTVKRMTGEFDVFRMLEENGGKNINSEVMKKVVKNLPEYCEAFLKDPAVRRAALQKEERPDLILLPAFMSECGLIVVRKWAGVPFIYVTTSGMTPWTADLVGTPEHPAYVPNQYLPYDDQMTLTERTVNTVMRLLTPYLRKRFVLDRLDGVARRFLGLDTAAGTSSSFLSQVEKNVSLVLVNSHHSLGFPRPLSPNAIEVGGMHCRAPRPIQDSRLADFLSSSSPNSVLLFSLGSQIKSSQMPESLRSLFVRAFSRIPYKVVWKFEGSGDSSDLKDLPSNVLLTDWLPQQDLLGHEAVGGFLTHGGLLSFQEAIYHGVPVIGLPIMSDQHLNVKRAEALGVGLGLELSSLTEDGVVEAVSRVMGEKSFRQKALKRSEFMKDQETKPLDRATFYVEYVLRHGGAKHLQPGNVSLSTASFYLIDVMALIGAIFVIILVVVYFTLKLLVKGLVGLSRRCLHRFKVRFFLAINHSKEE